MILRSKKIPFMLTEDLLTGEGAFSRMTNFTEFSVSKNPKEHTSKYVDEDFERSEIVAYAPSVNYKLDYEKDNKSHEKLVDISDNEKVGEEAKVTIAIVDMTGASQVGTAGKVYPCRVREFSVVPSSEGDDADILTYSGTLKAVGGVEEGYMQIGIDGTGTFSKSL